MDRVFCGFPRTIFSREVVHRSSGWHSPLSTPSRFWAVKHKPQTIAKWAVKYNLINLGVHPTPQGHSSLGPGLENEANVWVWEVASYLLAKPRWQNLNMGRESHTGWLRAEEYCGMPSQCSAPDTRVSPCLRPGGQPWLPKTSGPCPVCLIPGNRGTGFMAPMCEDDKPGPRGLREEELRHGGLGLESGSAKVLTHIAAPSSPWGRSS